MLPLALDTIGDLGPVGELRDAPRALLDDGAGADQLGVVVATLIRGLVDECRSTVDTKETRVTTMRWPSCSGDLIPGTTLSFGPRVIFAAASASATVAPSTITDFAGSLPAVILTVGRVRMVIFTPSVSGAVRAGDTRWFFAGLSLFPDRNAPMVVAVVLYCLVPAGAVT